MTAPESRFLTVDGRQVHLWEAGTGPTVVLLHGAGGHLGDMTFQLGPALASHYRVLAFDRPGLGLSEGLGRGQESPANQAAHLSQALTLLGVQEAVIVGHSYGGAVAMAWALNHPDQVAALVSLAGAVQPWEGGLEAFYPITASRLGGATLVPLIANLATPGMVARTITGIFAPDPVPDGYLAHIQPERTLQSPVLRANGRQVNTLLRHVTAMSASYPNLRIPLEILHGDADDTVPLATHSQPLAAQVPGANLVVLEGVGHMPHHANPEATLAAIDRAAVRAGLR